MRITPIDIQQQQFKSRLIGYDTASVDHFLELVAGELERLHKQNQELKEDLARANQSLEEMRNRESALKATLMAAQKAAEDMKRNATKESEIVVADAKLAAERIVRDAEERRIQLIGDIQEIKRQKISFETSLRGLIENHMRLLDMDVVQVQEDREDLLLEDPLPFERKGTVRTPRKAKILEKP